MDYDWTVRTAKVPYSGRNNVTVTQTYVLRGHDLPGYNYRVHTTADGFIFSRSCPGSSGGVRYYPWGKENANNLWKALDHGMKWARRHQKLVTSGEQRRFG